MLTPHGASLHISRLDDVVDVNSTKGPNRVVLFLTISLRKLRVNLLLVHPHFSEVQIHLQLAKTVVGVYFRWEVDISLQSSPSASP